MQSPGSTGLESWWKPRDCVPPHPKRSCRLDPQQWPHPAPLDRHADFLQTSLHKEHDHHQQLQHTFALALARKQLLEQSQWANFAKRPDDPAGEKNQGHAQRHVHVCVNAAKQWLVNSEAMRGRTPPTDRTYTRNKSHPISGQDKDKNSRKKPEGAIGQMGADDSGDKFVETFNEPLQELVGA